MSGVFLGKFGVYNIIDKIYIFWIGKKYLYNVRFEGLGFGKLLLG